MIERELAPTLRRAAEAYPVVTLTGPRQAGKTTLVKAVFAGKPYVNLEPLDAREYARSDPRGFLREFADGAVIDEVQHAPDLLSYLQADVDERPEPGRFILTGSQHFGLLSSISQSLAGRTAVLTLLPLSLTEVGRFRSPTDLVETLVTGAFPAVHDRPVEPARWYADYTTTYVQRDVRQVSAVSNLEAFTTFLRLCAGRTATEVNLSQLGADAGVSHNTARSWLSVLETGYVVTRLGSWHRSVRKQMVRRPKLHLIDSGLACWLIGITSADQLRHHPLRGAIFETWLSNEILKARHNAGDDARVFHFREANGLEVDLVVERGSDVVLADAKSGATVSGDMLRPLARLSDAVDVPGVVEQVLVHGGDQSGTRSGVKLVPWHRVADIRWTARDVS